ncbi:MAG: alpha/beta hydrolase [Lachnospiraceae bacterium]|nr:alpha/beta hydrolase [Lachnospiraceae bacterium]
MSLTYKIILKQMKAQQKRGGGFKIGTDEEIITAREFIDNPKNQMRPEKGVEILPEKIEGIPVEKLVPQKITMPNSILFYIHGGGMCFGNEITSRGYGTALANSLGIEVYTIGYRLAPEHKFPAGVDDCFTVYKELLSRYPDRTIGLIGESGGGTMVLTTALKAKAEGLRLPACIYSMNPLTTLAEDLPSRANYDIDLVVPIKDANAVLSRPYLKEGEDKFNPLVSPLYGDYTGFPPVKITVDVSEILHDDSSYLAEKLKEQKVTVDFKELTGFFHSFPAIGNVCPESKALMQETKAFFEAYL